MGVPAATDFPCTAAGLGARKFETPRPCSMPRVIITVADRTPQPYRFQLDRMQVSLGRGGENDIVIQDGSVSASHAVMERIEGGYQLRDLGSTNGIKLDGLRQEVIPLHHGSTVYIGDVAFGFTLSEDERKVLAWELAPQESPIVREDPSLADAAISHYEHGPRRVSAAPSSRPSGIAGFFMAVLFLLLATVAFGLGLTVRHQRETGRSLLEDLWNRKSATVPAAAPAEVESPTAE